MELFKNIVAAMVGVLCIVFTIAFIGYGVAFLIHIDHPIAAGIFGFTSFCTAIALVDTYS